MSYGEVKMTNPRMYEAEIGMNVNKPRLQTVLLRDMSGSMYRVTELEQAAYQAFLEEGKKNPITGGRTDLCVIDFNDDCKVVTDWTQLDRVEYTEGLTATGCTNLNEAIMTALEKIDSRVNELLEMDVPESAPLLVVITDGAPTSPIDQSVAEIKKRLEVLDGNELKTFMMLILFTADPAMSEADRQEAIQTLRRYTDNVVPAKTTQFAEVFSIIHNSVKEIHASKGKRKARVPVGVDGIPYLDLN